MDTTSIIKETQEQQSTSEPTEMQEVKFPKRIRKCPERLCYQHVNPKRKTPMKGKRARKEPSGFSLSSSSSSELSDDEIYSRKRKHVQRTKGKQCKYMRRDTGSRLSVWSESSESTESDSDRETIIIKRKGRPSGRKGQKQTGKLSRSRRYIRRCSRKPGSSSGLSDPLNQTRSRRLERIEQRNMWKASHIAECSSISTQTSLEPTGIESDISEYLQPDDNATNRLLEVAVLPDAQQIGENDQRVLQDEQPLVCSSETEWQILLTLITKETSSLLQDTVLPETEQTEIGVNDQHVLQVKLPRECSSETQQETLMKLDAINEESVLPDTQQTGETDKHVLLNNKPLASRPSYETERETLVKLNTKETSSCWPNPSGMATHVVQCFLVADLQKKPTTKSKAKPVSKVRKSKSRKKAWSGSKGKKLNHVGPHTPISQPDENGTKGTVLPEIQQTGETDKHVMQDNKPLASISETEPETLVKLNAKETSSCMPNTSDMDTHDVECSVSKSKYMKKASASRAGKILNHVAAPNMPISQPAENSTQGTYTSSRYNGELYQTPAYGAPEQQTHQHAESAVPVTPECHNEEHAVPSTDDIPECMNANTHTAMEMLPEVYKPQNGKLAIKRPLELSSSSSRSSFSLHQALSLKPYANSNQSIKQKQSRSERIEQRNLWKVWPKAELFSILKKTSLENIQGVKVNAANKLPATGVLHETQHTEENDQHVMQGKKPRRCSSKRRKLNTNKRISCLPKNVLPENQQNGENDQDVVQGKKPRRCSSRLRKLNTNKRISCLPKSVFPENQQTGENDQDPKTKEPSGFSLSSSSSSELSDDEIYSRKHVHRTKGKQCKYMHRDTGSRLSVSSESSESDQDVVQGKKPRRCSSRLRKLNDMKRSSCLPDTVVTETQQTGETDQHVMQGKTPRRCSSRLRKLNAMEKKPCLPISVLSETRQTAENDQDVVQSKLPRRCSPRLRKLNDNDMISCLPDTVLQDIQQTGETDTHVMQDNKPLASSSETERETLVKLHAKETSWCLPNPRDMVGHDVQCFVVADLQKQLTTKSKTKSRSKVRKSKYRKKAWTGRNGKILNRVAARMSINQPAINGTNGMPCTSSWDRGELYQTPAYGAPEQQTHQHAESAVPVTPECHNEEQAVPSTDDIPECHNADTHTAMEMLPEVYMPQNGYLAIEISLLDIQRCQELADDVLGQRSHPDEENEAFPLDSLLECQPFDPANEPLDILPDIPKTGQNEAKVDTLAFLSEFQEDILKQFESGVLEVDTHPTEETDVTTYTAVFPECQTNRADANMDIDTLNSIRTTDGNHGSDAYVSSNPHDGRIGHYFYSDHQDDSQKGEADGYFQNTQFSTEVASTIELMLLQSSSNLLFTGIGHMTTDQHNMPIPSTSEDPAGGLKRAASECNEDDVEATEQNKKRKSQDPDIQQGDIEEINRMLDKYSVICRLFGEMDQYVEDSVECLSDERLKEMPYNDLLSALDNCIQMQIQLIKCNLNECKIVEDLMKKLDRVQKQFDDKVGKFQIFRLASPAH